METRIARKLCAPVGWAVASGSVCRRILDVGAGFALPSPHVFALLLPLLAFHWPAAVQAQTVGGYHGAYVQLRCQNISASGSKFGYGEFSPVQNPPEFTNSFPPKFYLQLQSGRSSTMSEEGTWTFSWGGWPWSAFIQWTNDFYTRDYSVSDTWQYDRETGTGPFHIVADGSIIENNARNGVVWCAGDTNYAMLECGPFAGSCTREWGRNPANPSLWVITNQTASGDTFSSWGPVMISGFGINPPFQTQSWTSSPTHRASVQVVPPEHDHFGWHWDVYRSMSQSQSETLSDEYTTADLHADVTAKYNAQGWPTNAQGQPIWGGENLAYASAPIDETSMALQAMRYQIVYDPPPEPYDGTDPQLHLNWVEWTVETVEQSTNGTTVSTVTNIYRFTGGGGVTTPIYTIAAPSIASPVTNVLVRVKDIRLSLFGRCRSCTSGFGGVCPPGSGGLGNSSVDVTFEMGRGTNGVDLGVLAIHQATPSPVLATPAALMNKLPPDHAQVDVDGAGVIQQVRTPWALMDVVVSNDFQYALKFYAQTNGQYLTSGPPYVTWTIENPAATTNDCTRLRVNETRGQQTITNEYVWSAADQGWTLTTGNGLRAEKKSSSWSTNYSVRTEIRDILNPANQALVSRSVEKYQVFAWGQGLIESTQGNGADARTTTYTYDDVGRVKQTTRPDGSWEIQEYDEQHRPLFVYSSFGNQEPTTNAALCKVVEYSYSPVGGDTGTRQPNRTRRTITRLLGQEVAREYVVLLDGEDRQVQCATPGTAWNAADNLVTVTKFSTDTNSYGVITSVTQPDGTMSLYEYAYDGSSNLVSTVWTGKPGAAGTNIVDGTKTVSVHDPMGLKLSTTTADIASDIVTSQETYSEFDEFGRASRVTYLDGTFTLASHSCCGVESETSREGLTTSYLYDDLKRRIAVVRPGPNGGNLTMFTVYDAAGRTLQTIRQGEDDSQIVQQVTTYNTVGRTTSTTDALTNTTTYAESISGSGELVRTTIYPNGATHIQTQYKDGSSKSTTGTAVHGVRHEYGVETDGLGNTSAYTKIIRLDETGADTSEWAKTYTDMLGRAYLTKYPDGASARQFYNTKGQLWKTLDPDGVTQLHQYNNLGEQEYTALDMDRDDTIDFAGTDQITRTVRSVGQSSSLSGNAHISQTYIWTTNNVDSSLLISRSESLVDGTGSASTSFGLTSFSYHSCGGSCEGTNIAPDGTYTVTIKTNGYATRITRYDSNHAQLGRVLFGYDAHGRSSAVTNLLGSTADSAVPTGDSPAVQITLTSFDLLDRPVTMIRGVGTSLAQTNTHHYDTMGRLWRQIEPDATSVTNEFYLTSATKKTYGSRTYPVEWTYDYAGRQKTMKTWQDFAGNAGTATTTWNYDSQRGWLASKQYADGQGPSYTYTDAGRLETRTWARTVNGQPLVTTYGYDNAGQQNSIDYSDSTPDATYTHDRRGRQVAAASSSGNQTLTYNDASQLVAETWTSGPLNGLTVSNTYDGLLRRSDLSSFNDVTLLTHVTYGFDVASRLLSVSDGTNNATYSYLANSHLMSNIVFQQNTTTRMTTTKSYDNLGRLTSIGSVPSGIGVAPVSFEYQYNLANQRTAVTNADGSYWLYGYDTLGQVISGKRYWSDGVPVAGQQFEYGFDDIGNRKTAKSGGNASGTDLRSSIYQANALNQYVSRTVPPYVDITGSADTNATVTVNLLPATRQGDYFRREVPAPNTMKTAWIGITNVAVRPDGGNADILSDKEGHLFVPRSPETFGYDADGNMRSDGRFRYTWDAENRMVSAETTFSAAAAGAPRQKVDWSYLPDGRWSQRTVSEWNGSAWVPQATNRFVWDGVVLLAVLSGNNQVTQSYMRGTDLSGTMTGAGGVGGVLLTTDHGPLTSDTYANAFDGNGNVTRLVDMASGEAAAEYEYSPFGETLRSTGPMAEVNLLRFSTQFADGATAHYKYLHREYPPHLGRWPNRDPIGEDGGENVYVFTGNDPMRFVDFLGLRWKVDRKGGGKAPAEPEDGDTVADLANLIGLNAADYQKWLSPVGGSAMPTSSSQRLTKCDKFEIPNTVVAYWAGDLGWVGRWWVRWNSSIKYLGKRGFNVDDQRHQRGSTWALQTSLQSKAGAKELHGLYFWGHGTAPYPAQYLASSTGDVLLEFSSANLSYKMALGLVFACDSNAGQSALSSGTSGHIWKGFSGTLVPWPFRHYHARHYISPGQQETH